jgi:hypothetical protein
MMKVLKKLIFSGAQNTIVKNRPVVFYESDHKNFNFMEMIEIRPHLTLLNYNLSIINDEIQGFQLL